MAALVFVLSVEVSFEDLLREAGHESLFDLTDQVITRQCFPDDSEYLVLHII